MKYLRYHLPTGEKYEGEFNTSHHADFHEFNVISRAKLQKTAKELIGRWNQQHPDTWHYELKEEEVEHG